MKELSLLLQKFKNLGLVEHKIKDSFLEILKNEIDLELQRKDLEFKERKLRVNLFGPQKTEIILKKPYLLSKLNEKIKDLNIQVLDIN